VRSKNAIKNLMAYFLFEAVNFILNIIFPRYIILIYGSEINGLTSTIYKLLAVIHLIQAGAIGAAIFQMFKPIAENDYEKQSAIIYSSKKFYNIVTTIYFFLSCVLGIIYGFYLRNQNLGFTEIFLSFLLLGLSGSFTLLFNSICDIYVSSNQKAYYLKISGFVNLVVHYGLLIVVLALRLHFIFIYVAILCGSIVNAVLNLHFYKKLSKGKITKNPVDKKFVIPNRKFLMFSTIGTEAIAASPTIIITTFVSLSASSVFSIYSMVFASLKTILNSIQYSISPIFGNAVNTVSDEQLHSIYDCIELATLLLGTIASACCAFLIIPFVNIYTSGIIDANYLNVPLAIFVTFFVAILSIRISFNYLVSVYGLFKDLCKITLIFGALGILLSILFVVLIGFPYVMIGLLVNELFCAIAILVLLKKKIKWFTIAQLIRRASVLLSVTIVSLITFLYFNPIIPSFWIWILYAIVIAALSATFLVLYCVFFERKQLGQMCKYIKLFFMKRSKNNLE